MAWKKDTSLHCTGMKTNVERLLHFGCEWSIAQNFIATVTHNQTNTNVTPCTYKSYIESS